MEHIIQFGVTIDDEYIKRYIKEKATEKILSQIKKDIGGSYYEPDLIKRLVNKETQGFLEAHKDEIIEKASNKLADRLVRTKAVKEATQDIIKEVL